MKAFLLLSILIIWGCSTNRTPELSQKMPATEEMEEKVISRIDGLNERPSWLKESDLFVVNQGKVISLGSTVIPGNHRVDAAVRIALNNSKSGICSAIEQRLDFVLQSAQEGTAIDTNQTRFIGAEACKMTISTIRNGKVYWEKVAAQNEYGENYTQYKVYATSVMNESDLKTAILEAISKRAGKGGISKDFGEQVNRHWEKFINAEISNPEANIEEKQNTPQENGQNEKLSNPKPEVIHEVTVVPIRTKYLRSGRRMR